MRSHIGRWICLLSLAGWTGSVVASCGGSSTGFSVFMDGGPDASMTGSIGNDGSVTADDGPDLISADATTVACIPKTCAELQFTCGMNNDGCGNPIDCGTCTAPEFCGGGGYSKCGLGQVGDAGDGGYSGCTPVTCAAVGVSCGPSGDGCGGVLDCGSCTGAQFCGGAGPGQCGLGLPDGGAPCVPKTCASLGYDCGPAGDGCGGSLNCGTCAPPKYCGGGGFNMCGGNRPVLPDGGDAGNVVPCTPKTCTDLGINCGPAGDGCGGQIDCGTCSGLDICGGGGVPGVCGNSTPCNNLCQNQTKCDGGVSTTITGQVLAGVSAWTGLPADPVPNVLVYVPNSPVQPFTPGASCRQCGADVSGSPLVSTYTSFDGTFTLANVPAGANVPVVIQLGRWRRQFTIPTVPACATTAVGPLHLPRNQSEGDIPLTAISTGNVDPLECVLLKMGIDQAEFTPDSGTGRIHIYGGGALFRNPDGSACIPRGANQCAGPGSTAGPGTRQEPALLDGTGATFMNYDQVMLPCWGTPVNKTAAELANLITYADAGGHFFATHYSYSWLVGNGEMNNVATWNPNRTNPGEVSWTLNVSPVVPPSPPAPFTGTFAKWLNLTASLTNSGATVPANPQVSIVNARHDADGVAGGSVDWIDGTDQDPNGAPPRGHAGEPLVEHFTFNTPVGATSQCGHAIFSDFHVAGIANGVATNGQVFPAECTKDFTPQEKILEFMIWDLASCVPPPPAPTCTPITCAAQNIGCGPAGNGCGGAIDCGLCPPGQQCGGGGVYGQCIPIPDGGTCQPQTCAQQNISCGPAGDGCGSSLDCGPCAPPQTCGGGGVPGQCGGGCMPLTCAQQNINCGPAGDGCGNLLQCGTCPPDQVCGGGGVPGQCGGSACHPLTCAQLNTSCGPAGDGCGGLLDCGTCTPPETCGGGGVPGVCGGATQ